MMTATGKVFPIKNNAACVFKWSWNTFRLYTGESSSCHRVEPVYVSLDKFDTFNNTPEVQRDRALMLEGKWPDAGRGCEYCRDIEQVGGISDRTFHNPISGLTPVDFNPASTLATPRIVEVYLNNTCDLACVYCIPKFSSRINEEIKQHGPYPVGVTAIKAVDNQEQYLERYLEWLDKNYAGILRLHILGGEPLLQREFWNLLDFMGKRKHIELEFHINTNLNASPATVKRFVDTAKQLIAEKRIRRVDISCSLDCWGPQAEFIRNGLSLVRWQENFEYLISHKWLYINVHQVLNSLSIGTALELQNRIGEYKKTNPNITQAYHAVDGPNELIYRPEIFGSKFFESTLAELLDNYPVTRDWDNTARQRLEGIVKLIRSSTPDLARLSKLKETLDAIDHRRSTDWKSLFPNINEYLNNVL